MRLIGIDPGLRHTGWGIIEASGSRLIHVADGAVHTDGNRSLAERLVQLHDGLRDVIAKYRPLAAAVEETFVNKNPTSTLKLGHARGVVLLVPALAGLSVAEYPANLIKKSVVGAGHAGKPQVQMMVRILLPGCLTDTPDAADALAVAICHAHHAATRGRWQAAEASA
ncbi:MAG: crossover junction endodeoxyribonuclease RuvC [Rhodospirillaceae bacterium]|jgi:crossover junction endodeoxyribonuclease RuvC|nr:crossover junction endodeoxyribonuclease RuvC [Rhodospirillaceae bacterium]